MKLTSTYGRCMEQAGVQSLDRGRQEERAALRHVMVGILAPTSVGRVASLLADKDPAAALAAYERGHMEHLKERI